MYCQSMTKEPTSKLALLRAVQRDIAVVQQDLSDLAAELSTHPAKPETGQTYGQKELKAWDKVKGRLMQERAELVREQDELIARARQLKEGLDQDPVPMSSLQSIISKLTEVEARFQVFGKDEAWDTLSALLDTLERDEARVLDILSGRTTE